MGSFDWKGGYGKEIYFPPEDECPGPSVQTNNHDNKAGGLNGQRFIMIL
jgi:hypothetical protein